ncbi:MAG: AAA family ATPase [Myxococcales bacterium]|nr:AAA family ATPase [Myxococcales bacterium]
MTATAIDPALARSNQTSFEVAAGRFKDFFAELGRTFVERDDLLTQISLALLSREHVLMTGPPGTAKSGVAAAVLGRILDESTAKPSLFAKQFTESTVQTDLVGPIDFKTLMSTGQTEHFTDQGMLGAVHAFLDEVLDGRDMLLRTTLNVLNERELKQGNKVTSGIIECALMTTNRYLAEVLEGSRETLLAFVDRIAFVAFVPKGFGAPGSMGRVLRSQLGGGRGASWKSVLTIQDIDVLQDATDRVAMDDSLCETLETLMSAIEHDLAAASRADPSFIATRYLSTRTVVRLGKVLRAACVLDKISNPSRPLEVTFEDFERLRLSMLLSGPTPDQVASLLGRETDPRERRQLSIMRTEREIFDRTLAKIPRPKRVVRPVTQPSVDLAALERAVESAKPGGDTKALLETTKKIAVAVESGAQGADKARALLEGTVSSLVERALRKGLLAGAGVQGDTATGHPRQIAKALEELSQGLEKSASEARPIARWIRGRAIALLDDAASLASTQVGAALDASASEHSSPESASKRAGEIIAELEGIVADRERLERLGADLPPNASPRGSLERALGRVESEVVELMDGAFRRAIADALGRLDAAQLTAILAALGPTIERIDALGERFALMGGSAIRLKQRVVGPRIKPLLVSAFARLQADDRMALVAQIGDLIKELEAGGLGNVLQPHELLEMAATSLVHREESQPRPPAPDADAKGFHALRASDQRISLAFTMVEAASRIKEPKIGPDSPPDAAIAELTRAIAVLPTPLRVSMGKLDLERIDRAIALLEAFFAPLASAADEALVSGDPALVAHMLDRLASSRFFHVTRDEGALLRFSLEARVVGEVFPEVAAEAAALRARIDALEADSADRLERLRAVRADHQWKSVLAP